MKGKFGNLNAVLVGLFTAILSGVIFHFILGSSELLVGMGGLMVYMPYILAFFVGTSIAGLLSKLRIKDNGKTEGDD